MRFSIIIEGELDDSAERDSLYMNLVTHKLKVEIGKASLFDCKNIYWEREAVNGRTVSPNGEILCSD